MDRLMDDALCVRNLLPWIESDEEIIQFMRRIPLDKSHIRNQLALRYFIQRNDYDDNFEQNIEDDAREIVIVLPEISYKDIKDCLSILGNISNRKEVVIRQLLHKKWDLDRIINDIDVSVIRKRKSENSENLFDINSTNNQTNIKIKIRKVEGSLEVVSQITQENTTPTKVSSNVTQVADEPTSSTSISSSSSYSEPCNSAVKHEVPLPSTSNIDDPYAGLDVFLNRLIEDKNSTSEIVKSLKDPMSENNNLIDFATTCDDVYIPEMGNRKDNYVTSATTDFNNIPNNINANESFDLIAFIKEMALAPEKRIRERCLMLNLPLNKRPSASQLNFLLNDILDDDVIKVESDSDVLNSDSDTEQHMFNDKSSNYMEYEENHQLTSNKNKPANLNPTAKEFKLKEPVLNLDSMKARSHTKDLLYELDTAFVVDSTKRSILKPSKFTLPDQRQSLKQCTHNKSKASRLAPREGGVIPANLNKGFLQSSRGSKDRGSTELQEHYREIRKRYKNRNEPVFSHSTEMTPELKLDLPQAEGSSKSANAITSSSMPKLIRLEELVRINSNSDAAPLNLSTGTSTSSTDQTVTPGPSTSTAGPSRALPLIAAAGPSTVAAGPSTAAAGSKRAPASPTTAATVPSKVKSTSSVSKRKVIVEEKLFLRLVEMFPEACPDYLRRVCTGREWAEFDEVVTVILLAEYPKRPKRAPSPAKEVDLDEQYQILKELLPDADPDYLRIECEKYTNDDKGLKNFIDWAMEHKDYPTMKEYLRKQQISGQQKQYLTDFNVENFVQLFPEPAKTFMDPKRACNVNDSFSRHYITMFFRNKFDRIPARNIQSVLSENSYKIIPSLQIFLKMMVNKEVMKTRRKPVPLPENLQNIPVLQELAYITHKENIEAYLEENKKKEEQDRLDAKRNGLMQTCQCCYDDEVMPKDVFTCCDGCMFCKECIKKSCEVALGEGKTDFPCLANCSKEFSLQTLQAALPPKMFSKLAQKKALAEIKAAGIEDLVTCPFCDFASIPSEGDKIFRCLNPDCMKESCRACKEPNHVPLKCEEVEKDQDVKARTYIEDKMSEALIRKCWKCGMSFFKEEGCNKMTCSCGARMCYICKQPVTGYDHFNGIGGDKYELCPLYSDSNLINQQNVLTAAEAAKAEIDPTNLKVDPTADIADHYKSRAKELPREAHLDLLQHLVPPPNQMGHFHNQNIQRERQRFMNLWRVGNMNNQYDHN